jgi:hypothetical protein
MGGVVGLLVLLGVGVPAVVVGLAAVAPASALSVRTVMGRILVPMLVGIEPGCGRVGIPTKGKGAKILQTAKSNY